VRQFIVSAVSYFQGADKVAIHRRQLPLFLVSTNRLKAEYHQRIMDAYMPNLNASLNVKPAGKKPSELTLQDYQEGLHKFKVALFERITQLMAEF